MKVPYPKTKNTILLTIPKGLCLEMEALYSLPKKTVYPMEGWGETGTIPCKIQGRGKSKCNWGVTSGLNKRLGSSRPLAPPPSSTLGEQLNLMPPPGGGRHLATRRSGQKAQRGYTGGKRGAEDRAR